MGEWVKVITAIMTCLIGIVYSAFADCSGITSLTLPDSLTTIGEGAFKGEFLQ